MTLSAEYLGAIDPGDDRPPSRQIADRLRTAVGAAKLRVGDRLPSQIELAVHYDVARETIKAALRILELEGLITRRQGSGAYIGRVLDDLDPAGELDDLQRELGALRGRLRQDSAHIRDLEHRIERVQRHLRADRQG